MHYIYWVEDEWRRWKASGGDLACHTGMLVKLFTGLEIRSVTPNSYNSSMGRFIRLAE